MVKTVAIVSLSRGTIGEGFVKHEIEIGLRRLEGFGLKVVLMPHAMSGIDYVEKHPEDRAADLIQAMEDDSVDMILCAIGGDDTYRLLPHLFGNDELKNAIAKHRKAVSEGRAKEKIFLGFSDTTMNHLMLHKLGFKTFYGQSFLADVCELGETMYAYSEKYFKELIETGTIREVRPSDVWYDCRTEWGVEAIGTLSPVHENEGFQLLQGPATFSGKILGGCIDSLYDIFDDTRYADTVTLCGKYELFPSVEDWKGRILLLETSEEQPAPELYRKQLQALKSTGIFSVISGILCGKPMDEKYFEEYQKIIVEVVDNPALPIVANINIGHATPRCIMPFGVEATVDCEAQVIRFIG